MDAARLFIDWSWGEGGDEEGERIWKGFMCVPDTKLIFILMRQGEHLIWGIILNCTVETTV